METLRELGRSAKQKKEYEKIQKQNRDDNDDRRKTLIELGLPDNGTNRMRLRLWQEQAKGRKIGFARIREPLSPRGRR